MLMKSDSNLSNDLILGINDATPNYQLIKSKFEILSEKSPAQSINRLEFKKEKNKYVGNISIKSYGMSFYSTKTASTPYEAYLLLEEEIEEKLIKWKRDRFSEKLEKVINNNFLSEAQL